MRAWPSRVDELFECGAIKENESDVYDKDEVGMAFSNEQHIKNPPLPPKVFSEPPQIVYFVEDGDCIKIGTTVGKVKIRLSSLQVGNPRQLTLLGTFQESGNVEYDLHNRFHAYHIRGEWFRDNPELRALISARCPANDNAVAASSEVA